MAILQDESFTNSDCDSVRRWLLPLLYSTAQLVFAVLSFYILNDSLALSICFFFLSALSLSFSIHVTFHECVHAGVGLKSRLNPLPYLISFFSGVPFEGYRRHHFNHHRYNNSLEDYSSTWRLKDGKPVARNFLIYGLGWPVSFWLARKALLKEKMLGHLKQSTHLKIRSQSLFLLACLVLLSVFSVKATIFYLALIYTGWVITSLHNYLQHPPRRAGEAIVTSVHNRMYNFIFSNNGLHWEHHDKPALPWNQLQSDSQSSPIFKRQKINVSLEFNEDSRQVLTKPLGDFLKHELSRARLQKSFYEWSLKISKNLTFDRSGLERVCASLSSYSGSAHKIRFYLKTDSQAFKDYYSLQEGHVFRGEDKVSQEVPLIELPILAERMDGSGIQDAEDFLIVNLPSDQTLIPFPSSLCEESLNSAPSALLLPIDSDFDFLFANQIAWISRLKRRLLKSPRTWIKSFFRHSSFPFKMRVALSYTKIHPKAYVHPTAVIEGSEIQAGARIGAHCVVRFSVIGENARLHDGVKVEFSIVGSHSWLMHDLVLYRSYTEDHVFLIHGPYQFSAFQKGSAAFATIMMDYRADGKAIQVHALNRPKPYLGNFLGAVLKPGAKTLGGSLVAPGSIVPENTWLGCDPDSVHQIKLKAQSEDSFPIKKALSPQATAAFNEFQKVEQSTP